MSCHFCRAHAPFYALRGVMGSLGAEIPAGFYGVAEMRSPAEGSAARAACRVGVLIFRYSNSHQTAALPFFSWFGEKNCAL
jgi:hypothetical protein